MGLKIDKNIGFGEESIYCRIQYINIHFNGDVTKYEIRIKGYKSRTDREAEIAKQEIEPNFEYRPYWNQDFYLKNINISIKDGLVDNLRSTLYTKLKELKEFKNAEDVIDNK